MYQEKSKNKSLWLSDKEENWSRTLIQEVTNWFFFLRQRSGTCNFTQPLPCSSYLVLNVRVCVFVCACVRMWCVWVWVVPVLYVCTCGICVIIWCVCVCVCAWQEASLFIVILSPLHHLFSYSFVFSTDTRPITYCGPGYARLFIEEDVVPAMEELTVYVDSWKSNK